MKKITPKIVLAASLSLILSGALVGCAIPSAGPNTKAERKKMLSQDGGGIGWDAYSLTATSPQNPISAQGQFPPLPFSIADTVISLGSSRADFYLVRVPSANLDFLLPLAKAYEPYLTSYLGMWANTGRAGMAIDLSAGNATRRSVYNIESTSLHISVPLVVFYDEASEARVTNLTKFIQSLNTVQCTAL